MGPVISVISAERIRKQVADAGWPLGRVIDLTLTLAVVAAGAKALIPENHFPAAKM